MSETETIDVTGKDRIHVAREVDKDDDPDFVQDGQPYEELEVFNHVNVATRHYVNSVNGHETFEPQIGAGDMTEPPEYVTERIAKHLYDEWLIEVEKHGIEVIDVNADNVRRI